MKFLPYERFYIDTSLSLQEVTRVIAAETEVPRWWHWLMPEGSKVFRGVVSANGFRIARLGYYAYCLRLVPPVVIGTFQPTPRGTRVIIRMRPYLPVAAFMCYFFGLSLLISIAGALGEKNPLFLVGLMVFWAVGYVFVMIPFRYTVNKASGDLFRILGPFQITDSGEAQQNR